MGRPGSTRICLFVRTVCKVKSSIVVATGASREVAMLSAFVKAFVALLLITSLPFTTEKRAVKVTLFAPCVRGVAGASAWDGGCTYSYVTSRGRLFTRDYEFETEEGTVFARSSTPLITSHSRKLGFTWRTGALLLLTAAIWAPDILGKIRKSPHSKTLQSVRPRRTAFRKGDREGIDFWPRIRRKTGSLPTSFRLPISRSSDPSFLKLAGLCGKLFVVFLFAGFTAGKIVSPPFSDATLGEKALAEFLAANALALEQSQPESSELDSDGLKSSGDPSLVCGFSTYIYSPASRKVDVRESTFKDMQYDITDTLVPRPPSSEAVLAALFGGASTYTVTSGLKNIRPYFRSKNRSKSVVVTILAGVSGFSAGVFLGYQGTPPCGEEKIVQLLKTPRIWDRAQGFASGRHVERSDMH